MDRKAPFSSDTEYYSNCPMLVHTVNDFGKAMTFYMPCYLLVYRLSVMTVLLD